VIAVHQPDAVLDAMDEWNKNTHGRSGLIERVKASTIDEAAAEALYLDFMREYIPSRTSPMCGNSIGQDRRFMARYMPKLEDWFHYRNLDVSTLKELCRRWRRMYTRASRRRAPTRPWPTSTNPSPSCATTGNTS
jgi:oligoribonuclease